MKFCSNCGKDVTLTQIPNDTRLRYFCHSCETVHYENPKVVVGCIAEKNGQILLCKRAIEPCVGKWGIPAGYLEMGETIEQGAVRETFEESNAIVQNPKLFCLYSLPHIGQLYIYYRAELVRLDFVENFETLEAKMFYPEEIPWGELAFSSTAYALKKYTRQKMTVSVGIYPEKDEI